MFKDLGVIWSESGAEISIMLLIAFVLGYLVKVFTGNEKEEISHLEGEVSRLTAQKSKLKKDLKRAEKVKETASISAPPPSSPAVESIKDDLQLIVGIDEGLELFLNTKGIYSYGQLASTHRKTLEQILSESNSEVSLEIFGTWSDQAQLAAFGELENLKKLQEEIRKNNTKL